MSTTNDAVLEMPFIDALAMFQRLPNGVEAAEVMAMLANSEIKFVLKGDENKLAAFMAEQRHSATA